MGYIPDNARWWLADLIVEIQLEGVPGNLIWYNLTLIRAESAEEAYAKALQFGHQSETTETRPDGSLQTTRFRGLRDLLVIYEEPEDGSELLYEERRDLSEKELLASIRPKEKLSVFEPWPPPEEVTPVGEK